MKIPTRFRPLAAMLLAVLFSAGPLRAQESDTPPPGAEIEEIEEVEETGVSTPASKKERKDIPVKEPNPFYEKYLRDRLSIGTRMLWYSLTDTESGKEFDGSFIGSINRTTEDQDPAPVYLYAEYAISPYFGLGISYDQFKVVTLDGGGGDGSFELSGPILYGFGRLENGSAFTPFAEIGVAFYHVGFDAREEWAFSRGSPTPVNRFEPDDAIGFAVAAGVDIEIIEHLSANIYLRYVGADFDVDYFLIPLSDTDPLEEGNFPGDHFAYGIGLTYTF
ncbi:MAG: hypothetical protein ACLFRP_03550 [Puniceicoccaceae bacterium]